MPIGTNANRWWESDPVVDAPLPSAPPQQSSTASARPGVIVGPRKQPTIAEDRNYNLAVDAANRAQHAQDRADAAEARAAARDERAAQRDEQRLKADTSLTESQAKTTNFYNSALGAEREWQALDADPKTHDGTQPVGMLGDMARAVLPAGVVNTFTSDARQRAQQAKDNFIRASLRLESGAAIAPIEFERQNRIFFPQTGDTPDTLAQKARARQEVIEGFRIGAGPGAEKVDKLRGPSVQSPTAGMQGGQPPAANGSPPTSGVVAGRNPDGTPAQSYTDGGGKGELVFNDQMPEQMANAVHYTPEQRAAIAAMARTGTPDQMKALLGQFGTQYAGSDEDLGKLIAFYGDPKNANRPVNIPDVNNDVKPINPEDGTGGAIARGAADAATLGFLDEMGAGVDALRGNGSYTDNLNLRRGYAKYDEENHPVARGVGQFAGGLALPLVGDEKSLATLIKNGVAYGAAYGAGSANGGLGDRALGGLAGGTSGLAGSVVGAGIGKSVAGIGSKALPRMVPDSALPVIEAAERQGVPITVPDAVPELRGAYGKIEAVPLAGGRVNKDLAPGNEAIERRVAEIGGPDIVDQQTLGETLRTAGNRYVQRSGDVADRAYAIAAKRSGGQQITPTSALKTIDDQLADLARAPETNAEKIALLNKYRTDLVDPNGAPKAVDLDVLRQMRSELGSKTNTEGLRGTDIQRRAGLAMEGADQDIRSQLTGGALQAYDRADRIWKGRAEHIDRVVGAFIGGTGDAALSAEQIANNIPKMAGPRRGDAATLQKMMGTLNEQERSQVASTIAAQLGRRGDEAGENAFSSSRFFTELQKYSPAARRAIWGDQGAKDLADLARLAEARGGTLAKQNNSGSGRAVNFYNALKSMFVGLGAGAGVGAAAGAPGTGAALAAGGMASANGLARLLGSKAAVSALAYAARAGTMQRQSTAIRRIAALAAKEPALTSDLMPIKEQLEQAWMQDHRRKN